ncbi:MAG: UDP-2,4-diacetamido-2,4,6-trideoxy-beta-L-altropyranose hydrolase [Lachnospiraceae bacterium]|nr:UDP-2,4-diacetamido-2,4,6-trideoxy-beta-L-altropyranose hydrolase [Lachnospiraceae bacterium]
MIGIRVDSNSIIATGHMMRCITIAKAIVRAGGSVTFFIANEESEILLRENVNGLAGVNIVVLHTVWDDLESELPVLIEQLQLRGINMLLVDSYKVTYDYFKAISRVCKTAYIDDLHEGIHPVDVLINYSGYYDMFNYEADYAGVHGHDSKQTKLLLGLMYAPLREQFYRATEGEDPDAHKESECKLSPDHGMNKTFDILLACGGADTQNMILPTLNVISDMGLGGEYSALSGRVTNITWHVVVGDYVENKEEIRAFVPMHEGLVIHESVKDMATLMRSCDMAVVAAGTMLTECAAVRLPAVFYQVADNQRYGVQYWSAPERMIYAGNVTKDKDAVIASVIKSVNELIDNPGRINTMRDRLSDITDGRGAERIAEELTSVR